MVRSGSRKKTIKRQDIKKKNTETTPKKISKNPLEKNNELINTNVNANDARIQEKPPLAMRIMFLPQ
jgi:hypothetical protein